MCSKTFCGLTVLDHSLDFVIRPRGALFRGGAVVWNGFAVQDQRQFYFVPRGQHTAVKGDYCIAVGDAHRFVARHRGRSAGRHRHVGTG